MTEQTHPVTVELAVKGMTCASCAARLERALSAREGVLSAEVHLVTERAKLSVVPGTTLEFLCDAVEDTGFSAKPIPAERRLSLGGDEEVEFARISRRDGRLLVASALLSFPLVVPMLLMPFGVHVHWSPWFEAALATPVQLVLGARFYVAGYKALRNRSGNMDLLVALGTSAAYFYSLLQLVIPSATAPGTSYFEASAVVITLVRLGKWLESKAKRGTTRALRELMALQPERVLRRRFESIDGERRVLEEEVLAEEVVPGELIVVRPGERFATDGVIVEGAAAIDESMVTGESKPVLRRAGDSVVCGSLDTNGRVVVQVSKVGADSTLGQIVALVYGAQSGKAQVQRLVDRVSAVFVPIVLVVAVITFFAWLAVTHAIEPSLVAAVSVLVIACPCALGLATPTAIVAGTGAAARAGILVRDIDTLERASKIDTVVFDKTGTLTVGAPTVVGVLAKRGSDEAVLQLAASVEVASLHPLARAIVNAAKAREISLLDVTDVESVTGSGVVAKLGERTLRAGSLEWLGRCGVATDGVAPSGYESVVAVSTGDEHVGTIVIADAVRPTTRAGLRAIHERGVKTLLLSGDHELAVEHFAKDVGIDAAWGRVRPEEKQARVKELTDAGHRVAMVGDGINDSPALAAADVGIALGTGTQVAVQTANVVLMRPDLRLLASTLDVASATFGKIRQNLFWAFIYNCIGIPLAAAGQLSPMIAGLAMAFSSVSVVTNSLLLRRWRPAFEGKHGAGTSE
ncbi:MAG: heavy metal translocating P-type ATPase [Polyangiaceae bacterium]